MQTIHTHKKWTEKKVVLPYHPIVSVLGFCPKEMKSLRQRDICTPVFITVLFTISKKWKQPKYMLTDEWIREVYILIMENKSVIKKEQKPVICIITGTGVHNVKWNKSGMGRKVLPANQKWHMKIFVSAGQWWHKPFIPVLWRQSQADLWVQG